MNHSISTKLYNPKVDRIGILENKTPRKEFIKFIGTVYLGGYASYSQIEIKENIREILRKYSRSELVTVDIHKLDRILLDDSKILFATKTHSGFILEDNKKSFISTLIYIVLMETDGKILFIKITADNYFKSSKKFMLDIVMTSALHEIKRISCNADFKYIHLIYKYLNISRKKSTVTIRIAHLQLNYFIHQIKMYWLLENKSSYLEII